MRHHSAFRLLFAASLCVSPGIADGFLTEQPAQVRGLSSAASENFRARPLVTVGDTVEGYRPVGAFDGIVAMKWTDGIVRIFVNHEIDKANGYEYSLGNGVSIRGARISFFDIDRLQRTIRGAGLAYDTVVDQTGVIVSSAQQINEIGSNKDGFNRFCSGTLVLNGHFGFEDDIVFVGEETSNGRECVLDVRNATLYIVPQLGRHSLENVAILDSSDPNRVAILASEDREGAPLWLYLGMKNAIGDESFLDRNGLARGTLWVWKTDNGDRTPQEFHGTGSVRTGFFAKLNHYDPSMAGEPGWDSLGYATRENLITQAAANRAFKFSRLEDICRNPADGQQAMFAATGRGSDYPADNWGDTNLITLDFSGDPPRGEVRILYDGDDSGNGQFSNPDFGLRSPDNIEWANDGFAYIEEDRATTPESLFGSTSGQEASIWKIDPREGSLIRIAQVDRSAVPVGQTDSEASEIGVWETTGILDVTRLFPHRVGETVLLTNTHAKTLRGEPLGGDDQEHDLVRGGQLLFLAGGARSIEETGQLQPADHSVSVRVLHDALEGSSASFELRLSFSGHVVGRIYDVRGRVVRTLLEGNSATGNSKIEWDGTRDSGSPVPSGVYFVRFEAGNRHADARVRLIR
jgi:hypothetical protein